MRTVKAIYQRPVYSHGGSWLRDEPIDLTADCVQDGEDVIIAFTAETLAKLADLDMSVDELTGCEECATEAFWAAEEEACRVDYLAQRMAPSPPATREQIAFVALSALQRISERGAA